MGNKLGNKLGKIFSTTRNNDNELSNTSKLIPEIKIIITKLHGIFREIPDEDKPQLNIWGNDWRFFVLLIILKDVPQEENSEMIKFHIKTLRTCLDRADINFREFHPKPTGSVEPIKLIDIMLTGPNNDSAALDIKDEKQALKKIMNNVVSVFTSLTSDNVFVLPYIYDEKDKWNPLNLEIDSNTGYTTLKSRSKLNTQRHNVIFWMQEIYKNEKEVERVNIQKGESDKPIRDTKHYEPGTMTLKF